MIEAEEDSSVNANLMTVYFLYSKAKMRGSTLPVYYKNKIFKTKVINKELKTMKRNSSFTKFEHFIYWTNRL